MLIRILFFTIFFFYGEIILAQETQFSDSQILQKLGLTCSTLSNPIVCDYSSTSPHFVDPMGKACTPGAEICNARGSCKPPDRTKCMWLSLYLEQYFKGVYRVGYLCLDKGTGKISCDEND